MKFQCEILREISRDCTRQFTRHLVATRQYCKLCTRCLVITRHCWKFCTRCLVITRHCWKLCTRCLVITRQCWKLCTRCLVITRQLLYFKKIVNEFSYKNLLYDEDLSEINVSIINWRLFAEVFAELTHISYQASQIIFFSVSLNRLFAWRRTPPMDIDRY